MCWSLLISSNHKWSIPRILIWDLVWESPAHVSSLAHLRNLLLQVLDQAFVSSACLKQRLDAIMLVIPVELEIAAQAGNFHARTFFPPMRNYTLFIRELFPITKLAVGLEPS